MRNKEGEVNCTWKDSGCLELLKNKRYGEVKRNGKRITAHRWIFYLNFGYFPPLVMHKCDNPSCLNPLHLEPGTNKKNSLDMVKKGRQAKGEKNGGGGKLTEKQVREIKKLIPSLSLKQIADKYNVSKKLILLIKKEKLWKNINER